LDIDELKRAVAGEIDAAYPGLAELSRKLHDNPEIAFEEKRSAARLEDFLSRHGFAVEKGICQLPTAFRGNYGQGKPVIAFLAEYDALPKLGHACGHNLIATGAVAAGLASRRAVDALGGSVMVFGTPGEELYGGKAIMADRGAFAEVDVAMIAHPGGGHRVAMNTLACETLKVEFHGRAAHAGVIAARPVHGLLLGARLLGQAEVPLGVVVGVEGDAAGEQRQQDRDGYQRCR